MYRIFIIEDDPGIAEAVRRKLSDWGYEVKCAEDFKNIIEEFSDYSPHLVLMDIALPFYNGFYWCGEIRKTDSVPIIFISSASDNMNIVMAMNMGGDDFIAKPFDLSVLVAKVGAVLRRSYESGALLGKGEAGVLRLGSAVLNTADASLCVDGERIELTKNEYRILVTLLENKGRVVSRETLMNRLWETDCFVDENTLTVNVARLRKKLDGAGLSGFISTKVGMGYIVE